MCHVSLISRLSETSTVGLGTRLVLCQSHSQTSTVGLDADLGKPGHCPGKILVSCAYCLPIYCLAGRWGRAARQLGQQMSLSSTVRERGWIFLLLITISLWRMRGNIGPCCQIKMAGKRKQTSLLSFMPT